VFNFGLAFYFGSTPDGKVNLEAMSPPPFFTVDDDWWFATLGAAREPVGGLTLAAMPPYARYASNANQVSASGNPFAAQEFRNRWYADGCSAR
jgi:hypothetical protein